MDSQQLQLNDLKIEQLQSIIIQANIDPHSYKAYSQKEHIIIGISPANGYFTHEVIQKLTFWALSEFKKVSFIDPSDIYRYTLNAKESQGVDSQIQKAVKQFEKKVKSALKAYLNIKQDDQMDKIYDEIKLLGTKMQFWQDRIQVITCLDLFASEGYRNCLKNIEEQFENDQDFRKCCIEFTKTKLLLNRPVSESNALIGVKYLLYELPFIINGEEVFNVPASVDFYHKTSDIYYYILKGQFKGVSVGQNSGNFLLEIKGGEQSQQQQQQQNKTLKNGENKQQQIQQALMEFFKELGTQISNKLEQELNNNDIKIVYGLPSKDNAYEDNVINIWFLMDNKKPPQYNLTVKVNERGNENNERSCQIINQLLGCKLQPKNNGIIKVNLKQTNYKVDSQQIENIVANIISQCDNEDEDDEGY